MLVARLKGARTLENSFTKYGSTGLDTGYRLWCYHIIDRYKGRDAWVGDVWAETREEALKTYRTDVERIRRNERRKRERAAAHRPRTPEMTGECNFGMHARCPRHNTYRRDGTDDGIVESRPCECPCHG